MRILGELCLLGTFVSSGFAAFACIAGGRRQQRYLLTAGRASALASVLMLTVVTLILARALIAKDFQFTYVAQYSSNVLPWFYSLSALWVGQAGSLLLWAWFLGALATVYRFRPGRDCRLLRDRAFGVLMGYLCFLVAIMVFAADPMAPSVASPQEGAGLSPLLQHPAMLIHPPLVLLAFAMWAVPFALVIVGLADGQLDANWVRQARPWALAAWITLGAGILLGAHWAYEELGWGGYWGWDPVENGSLIPWLTGTALIHTLMTWQYRRVLKKTAVALALATFGLCNFSTFLTRSGIFSSLHAFSQSPIGWLFLVLMVAVAVGGGYLLVMRRRQLAAEQPIGSVLSREGVIVISTVGLLLLAAVTLVGTLYTALSGAIFGRAIMVGPAFYTNVLIPIGLVLLATTAMAPLLQWGNAPTATQKKWLTASACAGGGVALMAFFLGLGLRHPVMLAVVGLSVMACLVLGAALVIDCRQPGSRGSTWRVLEVLQKGRSQYAGFVIHLGFVYLALGVTASSLGTQQQDFEMRTGETVAWAGREVRLWRTLQRELPDKLVAEAELEILRGDHRIAVLRPARHFHRLQEEWTTEVDIHATWGSDYYTILHHGTADGKVSITLIENPLMRGIWCGGLVMGLGGLVRLWPARRRVNAVTVPLVAEAGKRRPPYRRVAAATLLLALGLPLV